MPLPAVLIELIYNRIIDPGKISELELHLDTAGEDDKAMDERRAIKNCCVPDPEPSHSGHPCPPAPMPQQMPPADGSSLELNSTG